MHTASRGLPPYHDICVLDIGTDFTFGPFCFPHLLGELKPLSPNKFKAALFSRPFSTVTAHKLHGAREPA